MQTLNQLVANPSGWDSLSNYSGETEFGAFDALLTQNRDSGKLTRSNFEVALKALGGESDNVEVHRFGHWACGWWEVIAVKRGTPEYRIAEDIEASLSDYPVLDDEHYSQLEWNEAGEFWQTICLRERVEICQRFNVSVFAARRDEIPEDSNGSLFQYLASD